ncbi:hypothetical protein CERSUDRAFT_119782 [Gelatoporia subvermispora B]|uniref:Protein kinase domain-containing protein n=1 Tax=Ceriporiopsis subvermispora (strain B) TaxID=914234 RepID=M2QH79_CERS8|nr:hypothetical protein CERSUDRAFT_119782 [Gelatoporia subvermispora B]
MSDSRAHSRIPSDEAILADELMHIWRYLSAKANQISIRNYARDSHVHGSASKAPMILTPREKSQTTDWIEMLDELIVRTKRSRSTHGARRWYAELSGPDSINSQRVQRNQHLDDCMPLISAYLDMLRKLCKICRAVPSSIVLPSGRLTSTQTKPGQAPSSPIGSGGFGDVWKGSYCGDAVAIKVIRNPTGSPEIALSEAIIWKHLDHPNITPFYGIDTSESRFSLVSQWMEHGTIKQYLRDYPDADRSEYVLQIAGGLRYLHDLGIVHGDLITGNILVNSARVASLVDFGLAAICYDGQLDTSSAAGQSRRWTAPEVIDPETYGLQRVILTKESDIYSWAITIWEIYTNEVPFRQLTYDAAVTRAITTGQRPLRSPQAIQNGLDDDLWQLLQLCWNDKRNMRPLIGSVLSCIVAAPTDSRTKYRVRRMSDPRNSASQPADVARPEELAPSLSEWLASYVWDACTAGIGLSVAYAAPGGFTTPQPPTLAAALAQVLSILPPQTVFLAAWYIGRLPVYFGDNTHMRHQGNHQQLWLTLLDYSSSHPDVKGQYTFVVAILGVMLARSDLPYPIADDTLEMASNIPLSVLKFLERLARNVLHDSSTHNESFEQLEWLKNLRDHFSQMSRLPIFVPELEGLLWARNDSQRSGTTPAPGPAPPIPRRSTFTHTQAPTAPLMDRRATMPIPAPSAPRQMNRWLSDSPMIFGEPIAEAEEETGNAHYQDRQAPNFPSPWRHESQYHRPY